MMEYHLTENYSDSHRAFLQAFIANATLTFEQAQPILAAILNADGSRASEVRAEQISQDVFQDYIDVASDAASAFDYEVRSITDQVSRQRIYALVNTQSDPQTQLATIYSPEELGFIKRALDGMFDKFNTPRMEIMALTQMQAMKFARPPYVRASETALLEQTDEQTAPSIDRGLKHSEVETVLASLVEAGWFARSREGFYALTPRALLELRPWLTETYNEVAAADEWQRIKFCEACKDIVTIGLRCSEPSCLLRLHDMCQDAFWRVRRSRECPKCQRTWAADRYVGERAVTMTEAYRKSRGKSGGRKSTLADDIIQRENMIGDDQDSDE